MYGAELEAEALLGGGWAITSAVGYIDARYTRLNNVTDNGALLTLDSCPLRESDPDDACDLPKTPKYKFCTSALQYCAALPGGGSITLNADYTYTSTLFNDLGNEELLKREPTNIVNASITYSAPDEKWSPQLRRHEHQRRPLHRERPEPGWRGRDRRGLQPAARVVRRVPGEPEVSVAASWERGYARTSSRGSV